MTNTFGETPRPESSDRSVEERVRALEEKVARLEAIARGESVVYQPGNE